MGFGGDIEHLEQVASVRFEHVAGCIMNFYFDPWYESSVLLSAWFQIFAKVDIPELPYVTHFTSSLQYIPELALAQLISL